MRLKDAPLDAPLLLVQARKRLASDGGLGVGQNGPLMPDRESIGAFVRRRRRANGLTQAELAELAGVGTRFVSELERDKPTVRLDAVDAVLAVFGKEVGVVDVPRSDDEEVAP